RRAGRARAAPPRPGRRVAACPALPEPPGQRRQVPRRAAPAHPRLRAQGGRPRRRLRGGQRHRHRPEAQGARLRHLPTPRPRQAGHGHRPRHREEDRRAARRPHLGGARAGRRLRLLLHAAPRGGIRVTEAPIILLAEDNEWDARVTREALAASPIQVQVELLRDLKADEELRRVPVIVLTTSMAPQDIRQAYDLHANAYLHKPVDPDDYAKVVRAVEEFWVRWSVPPDARGPSA